MSRAGASRRPVILLAILAATMLVPACYSSNYRRETLASVSLVSQLSDKLADYSRANFKVDDHILSSEEMGEFYYGLEKARSFQQMTAHRGGASPSAAAFAKLADSYDKFVHDADQYRLNPSKCSFSENVGSSSETAGGATAVQKRRSSNRYSTRR